MIKRNTAICWWCKHFSPEKKIVNELIQTDVNKKNLIIELDKLMNEDNNQMALDFVSLHNSLINRDKFKFFDVLNSI